MLNDNSKLFESLHLTCYIKHTSMSRGIAKVTLIFCEVFRGDGSINAEELWRFLQSSQ